MWGVFVGTGALHTNSVRVPKIGLPISYYCSNRTGVLLFACEGVLLMTAEEKYALLTPENKGQVILQIETLIRNQSKNQSSPDSQE